MSPFLATNPGQLAVHELDFEVLLRTAVFKTLIGSRCKQSGMFWSTPGAQNILALRCVYASRRWDQFWKERLNTRAAANDCLDLAAWLKNSVARPFVEGVGRNSSFFSFPWCTPLALCASQTFRRCWPLAPGQGVYVYPGYNRVRGAGAGYMLQRIPTPFFEEIEAF